MNGRRAARQSNGHIYDWRSGGQLTFLTPDELIELTRKRRHDAQARMLRAMGIEHRARPGECPAVLRSHVEHLLGGVAPAKVAKQTEPDWSAIV